MKILKRLLITLAVLLCLAIIAAGAAYLMINARPFQPHKLTAEERSRLANQARAKMTDLGASAQGLDSYGDLLPRNGRPTPATAAAGPITVTFSEEEINAFLDHYFEQDRAKLDAYVKDAGIALQKGRIILFGTVPDLDKDVSFHFEPTLDAQDRLNLQLAQSQMGSLPLPDWALGPKIEKVKAALVRDIPRWQAKAKMSAGGRMNDSAVNVGWSELLLNCLNDRPSPNVLYVLTEPGAWVPVRLTSIAIEDHAMTLTLRPLTPPKHAGEMERIKAK